MAHDKLYPEWAAKKSLQVETPSRVGKSRCYSCFLIFFVLPWWVTAQCTMLSSIAHVCAGYASSFPAWKRLTMTYRWSLQGGALILSGILILSATGKKGFRCLFELLVHLDPLHPLVRAGDARHQTANENESVTCSPGPISPPLHWTLQTPSRSNGLIGEEKRLLQAPIVPKCKPKKSQIKGRCQRSSLTHRD